MGLSLALALLFAHAAPTRSDFVRDSSWARDIPTSDVMRSTSSAFSAV
jgi:hypothetical protein